MGFFDKLKEAVNTVMDSVQGGNGSNQSVSVLDEETKKYYEIIRWMRTNQGWYCTQSEKFGENLVEQRYIELVIGEPCDEEKFKKAVELIKLGEHHYPSDTKDKLGIELNAMIAKFANELKAVNAKNREGLHEEAKALRKYDCDRVMAHKVCYKELIADIKSDYEAVLEVIKDDVNLDHFLQGFEKKIAGKYKKEYSDQFDGCVHVVISDSFFEGNPVTRKILFELLLDILDNRVNGDSSDDYEPCSDVMLAFALRAVHFEKYGKEREAYSALTDEECRELVLKMDNYVKTINDHPFEKEEYTQMFTSRVKKTTVLNKRFSSYDDFALSWLNVKDIYFLDALYHFAWKEIAKEYEDELGESTDSKDVANMIYGYIKDLD